MLNKKIRKGCLLVSILLVSIGIGVIYISKDVSKNKNGQGITQDFKVSVKEESKPFHSNSLKEDVVEDLEDLIQTYLSRNNIETTAIALSIHDFESDAVYQLNADEYRFAASTYKLVLAMLYYEKIKEGSLSFNDTFQYLQSHYEEGGPIAEKQMVGSFITIRDLLYNVIVYSDNTAANILTENFGGWVAFKKASYRYFDVPQNMYEAEILYENLWPVSYFDDALTYLYHNQDTFAQLIQDMKIAMPNNYLNRNLAGVTYQKYGYYNTVRNSVGITLQGHPYAIAIFTNLQDSGIQVMADINEICWNYFNTK